MDSPLQPTSDRLDPTPSIASPSTSSPTAQTPPVTPTLACCRPFPTAIPLHHREAFQWAPPLYLATNPVCHHTSLLPGHSTADHRPLADRILPASRRCRWGREPPLVLPWAESMRWAGPSPIQMGRATLEAARLNSALCKFSIRLNLINSNKMKSILNF
jgi:hypothetical protein